MSQDMSQEGEEKAQTKKITLVIMKRSGFWNNPGNEARIKSQEKVHEATLVSQARSKLLRNSIYPELSVVHAQNTSPKKKIFEHDRESNLD